MVLNAPHREDTSAQEDKLYPSSSVLPLTTRWIIVRNWLCEVARTPLSLPKLQRYKGLFKVRNLVRLCPRPLKTSPLSKHWIMHQWRRYNTRHVRSSLCETNRTAPSFRRRFDDKWRCSITHCLLSTHGASASFIHEALCCGCDCYADFVCYLQRAVNNTVRAAKSNYDNVISRPSLSLFN